MQQTSQNAQCPCGSGKKYKRCCGATVRTSQPRDDAKGRFEEAMLAYEAKAFKRARALLDQVLKTHPDDPGLLGVKGMAYYSEGLYQEAFETIERAISINSYDSRLFNFLGQIYAAQNRQISAEQAFGRAVTLDPDFLEAWYNLGTAQFRAHRPARAIKTFLHLRCMQPNDGELSMQLMRAYYSENSIGLCSECLNKARSLGIDVVKTELWGCAILYAQGDVESAKNKESELQCRYGNADVYYLTLLEIAMSDAHLGRLDSAEYWLAKGIALRPDIAGAYSELASIKKFKEEDRVTILRMCDLLKKGPLETRRGLEFAIGKAYTDIGEYDASFLHYKAGNDLARETIRFDAAAYIKEIDEIIDATPRSYLEQLPAGSGSNLPILIVGTPRSGTTLIEQVISSHKQIGGAGEVDIWPRVMPSLLNNYNVEAAGKIARIYLDVMSENSPGSLHVTDKLPINYQSLGFIHAVFPNAKLIHVKRHPIDACLSIYFQNFNDEHDYKWDMESIAVWYEQYQRLMAHWRSVLPADALFEFRYEDLVEDTEGVSRKIMEFLGLEWEPGQLDFHKQDRAVFTASKWQARQPIYKTSRERWRRYEKHLGPLLHLLRYA